MIARALRPTVRRREGGETSMTTDTDNMQRLNHLSRRLSGMATAMSRMDGAAAHYLDRVVREIGDLKIELRARRSPAYDPSYDIVKSLWTRVVRDRDEEAQEGETAAAVFLEICLQSSMYERLMTDELKERLGTR